MRFLRPEVRRRRANSSGFRQNCFADPDQRCIALQRSFDPLEQDWQE